MFTLETIKLVTKLLRKHIFILLVNVISLCSVHAVDEIRTVGNTGANYGTLKAAFDAINAGTLTGNITLQVISSITTETTTATLNASGSGSANYSSVAIYPTVANCIISGNLNAPLIWFSGAQNVTIDGRVNRTGSTPSMTINNTSTGGSASTIRLNNAASNNNIRYCTIRGAQTGLNSGIIQFLTSSALTGNSDNIIEYCNITGSTDTNRPVNGVFSLGALGKENKGNIIRSNNFYNFLNRAIASNGINLSTYSSDWLISENSFYETQNFIPTNNVTYNIIRIVSSTGTNFSIISNFIGGTQSSCGGTAWRKTNATNNTFNGIYLSNGNTSSISIQGNTISNFDWNNSENGHFTGINVASGGVDIGNLASNKIGTPTGRIIYYGGTTNACFFGIRISSFSNINCHNNVIESIIIGNTDNSNATNFIGIRKENPGLSTIQNNRIGSADVHNAIHVVSESTANAQYVIGIDHNFGYGTQYTINGNSILQLFNETTNTDTESQGFVNGIRTTSDNTTVSNNKIWGLYILNKNTSNNEFSSACGIVVNNSTGRQIVRGNTISDVGNGNETFTGSVMGIYYSGRAAGGGNRCDANFIYTIYAISQYRATIFGIKIAGGLSGYANNIISIGNNSANSYYGIYDSANSSTETTSCDHNTVYIGASLTSGTAESYALFSSTNVNYRNYRNNIFCNVRDNVVDGNIPHYAAYFDYDSPGNMFLNYNNYYVSGSSAVLGYFNSTKINSLPLISGQDANSSAINPLLHKPGTVRYDLSLYLDVHTNYLPSANLPALTGIGITTDFTGASRTGPQSMGALIYAIFPNIITHPVSQSVCVGSEVSFIVEAENVVSYQWKLNGVAILDATSATYNIKETGKSDEGTYTCDITNHYGTVITNDAILTILTLPSQPSSITGPTTVLPGSTGHIYSITSESDITYSWSYSGTGASFTDSGHSINVSFATIATSGTLSVTPINSCGSGTASTLEITVTTPPVEIWKAGVLQKGYPTLKAAFDDLNDGVHFGSLEIRINSSTLETQTAVLNASEGFASMYDVVKIFPTNPGLEIMGNIAGPLINLNGANNITFDGRVNLSSSEANQLTLINNSTSATPGTSVVTFINDASNNTIQYCVVKAGQTAFGCGAIHFSTTTKTTGNDNNTLQFNHFTGINSNNRPAYTIHSSGTASKENNNITIHQNHFYDYLGRGTISYAIYLTANTTACTITHNQFYQPTTLVPTAANAYGAIIIDNPSGNGFVVNNNVIGGTTANAEGGKWTNNSTFSNSFWGIFLKVGTATASNIQGNTIRNFNWTTSGAAQWNGIIVGGGNVNMGTTSGNNIGSDLETESILANFNNNSSKMYPISSTSSGHVNIHHNMIGGLAANNSNTTFSASIYAISVWSGTSSIQDNTVGSNSVSNSIITKSPSTGNAQILYGIYAGGTSAIVSGNRIFNLTNLSTNNNASHAGLINGIYADANSNEIVNNKIGILKNSNANNFATATASVAGIVLVSTGTNHIYKNDISELTNTHSSFSGFIYGIYSSTGTTNNSLIYNNIINRIRITGASSTTGNICGIRAFAGKSLFYNNIIILDGNSRTTLYGLYDTGTTGNPATFNFNTVYIGGVVSSGTNRSYALYSQAANNIRDFRNNILYNERSTSGGLNLHYAVFLNYSSASLLTINYNDYYTSGTGGTLGFMSSSITSIENWRTATGQDQKSISENPNFSNSGGFVASDYAPSAIKLFGNYNALVLTDYNDELRDLIPTMGAIERLINKWKGTLSDDWAIAANWTKNLVPEEDHDLFFDSNPLNHCVLDNNHAVGSIYNSQSTYHLVTNGHTLQIKGDILFENNAKINASSLYSTVEFAGSIIQSIPTGTFVNNQTYNLKINNNNNVILNGSLNLLYSISAISGKLEANNLADGVTFGGTAKQEIADGVFLDNIISNLIIDNTAGVTINTSFFVNNNLTINLDKSLLIGENKQLTVYGNILNSAGVNGLILKSSSTGTASLIHHNNDVPATVQRYIGGTATGWHFLSAPLSNQAISGDWKPAGTYGDGTGYDLYVWDEPNSCWIYNLNNSVAPTWGTVHPQSNFVTGKGYLYALQATNTTKTFSGNLNNGNVTINLSASATSSYQGFSMIGNPYPSSIDWKVSTGYSRSLLQSVGGGYDIWIWNPAANNYGVYNSANVGDTGTNGVGRYIAPMQGFFIQAANPGNMIIYNNARNHAEASNWKINKQSDVQDKSINIKVESSEGFGSDEIKLLFGNYTHEIGSRKLFSHVETAPSIFLKNQHKELSIMRINSDNQIETIDCHFKPGIAGTYSLSFKYNENLPEDVVIEDLLTGRIVKKEEFYSFTSKPGEIEKRFRIRFSNGTSETGNKANVYVRENHLILDLKPLAGNYISMITDASGRLINQQSIIGGTETKIPLQAKGVYLIQIISESRNNTEIHKAIF